MHFGVPSTKNKMARVFGAGGPWTMFINFPGLDKETKIVGDEAVFEAVADESLGRDAAVE